MKILFLNTLDDPADGGGAEVTMWTLMRALTEAGHQCILLATSKGHGLQCSERDGVRVWRAGIRNIYWPGKRNRAPAAARLLWHAIDSYNPLMQGYLEQILETEKPDVVSIHNLPGWSSAAWGTVRRAGIPSVQVLHDQYALCPKSAMFNDGCNCQRQCMSCRLLRLPHRALSNGASAVVGVSRFILDRHLDYGCFAQVAHQRVIHNARQPSPLGLDAPNVPHAGLRIGFIGRLDPTKGVEALLQAFREYERPDAELWIAGTGKSVYQASLPAMVQDPRVRFLGHVSPREFYPQVDFVVVPSLWNDTFPGVVFESLAFGKPVIGSRRGGIPEMIRDGANGLLFDPDRPQELVAALWQLSDDSLRERMGRDARESAASFLDVNAWVDLYVGLYRELVRSVSPLPETT
ncbi:glycosyltransferase family 4 protein [Rhodanobacter sp. MP7CTX1]|uniref:glycosyltransferase family 4 protein n=1 Tax=Rhodanobacter sp. MP7CTX1 TaxID=2723084 RepID=UPI00161775AC|nr:glycosyltransferase family 4 protein [Rhodanobacter sp. MP7CTX1]MBB6186542.1 glycosyltransferase involved in cell wall biosynthesis [Rhodanobacter sp. MP7CTX1]